jgi:purine-binding chemotaxis protein CheW
MNKEFGKAKVMITEPHPSIAEERESLIVFRLQGEWFGLRVEEVREIVLRSQITRVPRSFPSILGLMNLRGKLLTIIDLDHLLGLPPAKMKERSRVIVLNLPDPEMDIGFLVDEVAPIREVFPPYARDPSAALSEGRKAVFFRGALYSGGLLINVLNPSPIVPHLVPEREEASA